jgi:hypothetical protein
MPPSAEEPRVPGDRSIRVGTAKSSLRNGTTERNMNTSTLNRIRRALSPAAPRIRMLAAAIAAGAAIGACDVHGTTGTSSPGTLSTIVVTPNATVATSGTVQMVAVGHDANGGVVVITPTWSVVALGGTISTNGLFTAGTTTGVFANTVVATVGTITGSASITVTSGAVATVVVSPTPATLAQGATQQFTAVAKDANGNVITPFAPTWSVVASGGTVNATGLFTAGATVGTFTNTVKAASGAASGLATVIVSVNLLTASPNGIMAGTAVTCVTGGTINANVSVSPGNTVTGFGPCVITGVQHLGDATALQGQLDLTAAYNTLAGLPCPPANAIVADLGGTTKTAGVYCTASGIGVTGVLTLDGGGDPNASFVFQAGTSLTTAGNILLINGAQAKNVNWVVGTSATLGVSSLWQGNILAVQSITLVDNATLLGRALARNGAVSLGTNNTIILP